MSSWRDLLAPLSWRVLGVTLRNTRNTFARERPLSIFNGVFKSAAGLLPEADPDLFIFHPLERLPERMAKGREYRLELVFPHADRDTCESYVQALAAHLADPDRNFELVSASSPVPERLEDLRAKHPAGAFRQEACLNFLTPLPFDPEDKHRQWMLSTGELARRMANRVRHVYGVEPPDVEEAWSGVRVLPYYWRYVRHTHRAKSAPGNQFINGGIGPLYLKGDLSRVLPRVLVCSRIHAGRRASAGPGYFRLEAERPHFDRLLARPGLAQEVARRLDRDTDGLEERDTAALLDKARQEILDRRYEPAPARVFFMSKPGGGSRGAAALEPADLMAQRLLHHALQPALERMFEHASIGFRRGRSRGDAARLWREYRAQGFCHALESDIESFFDGIDHGRMMDKLAACMPVADKSALAALEAIVRDQPALVDGNTLRRGKGLLPGSPLAPLLSNLYLDELDERMEALGYRMIRYADDFVILARSPEECAKALEDVQDLLAEIGLGIKESKTAVHGPWEPFSFLGLDFAPDPDPDQDPETPEAALRRPLYLGADYSFLGQDHDSFTVRKNGKLKARVPVRRVSEVVVFGTNTLSTRVMARCARSGIPVSFCSPSGHYLATSRPDSKAHFEKAAAHHRRFEATLGQGRLDMARSVVRSKLNNYCAWFETRHRQASRPVVEALERAMAALDGPGRVEALRGLEGSAAKKAFGFILSLVKAPGFECRGRVPRKKPDRFNALLDFAHTLFFTRLNVMLRTRGLSPYLGFLHSHKDDYESLVCDLQEPFRARAERWVLNMVNRQVVKAEDFEPHPVWGERLRSPAVGRVLRDFEREMRVRGQGDQAILFDLLRAQADAVAAWAQTGEKLRFHRTSRPRRSPLPRVHPDATP